MNVVDDGLEILMFSTFTDAIIESQFIRLGGRMESPISTIYDNRNMQLSDFNIFGFW